MVSARTGSCALTSARPRELVAVESACELVVACASDGHQLQSPHRASASCLGILRTKQLGAKSVWAVVFSEVDVNTGRIAASRQSASRYCCNFRNLTRTFDTFRNFSEIFKPFRFVYSF